MGFIQRIRRFFNLSLTDPKAWNRGLWNLYGAADASGENVTEQTALTYSVFWCAVHLISKTIGSLPLHLMQRLDRGNRYADELPLYRVMHDNWNPFMTAKVGRQTIAAHVLTWGNGYAEKVLDGYGEVVQLWPISPDRVTGIKMVDNDLIYEVQVGNEKKYLPKKQILHLHGLGFDGFVGYSVVSMARKTIGLGMAMEKFGSNLFSQGINPGAVVTMQTMPKDSKAMREAMQETYAGLGKTHRLMLLEDGMKFERTAIPANDSQFLESRGFQVPEIARWFDLPPHKLRDLTKSSFNNIESEQISFVTDSILPWLIDFEQEYFLQLLSERQRYAQKLYFKHIVEGLLRADAKSRGKFYEIMVRNGIYTRNECRVTEDKNPNENPMADELWVEANMIPMSRIDEFLSKNKVASDPKASVKNLIEFNTKMGATK